jgi:two-component system, NarL family, nitrate/nitrite response regulator NarL
MSENGFKLASQPVGERMRTRMSRLTFETRSSYQTTRILIADDHPILRDGLRALLRTEPDFHVIGEATDGRMAVELARELRPDILLLDWGMSRQEDMRVLRELTLGGLSVRTLLMTVFVDNKEILRALQFGAWGVVLRDSTTKMLFEAIRKVMEGQYWIGRESVASLVDALRDFAPGPHLLNPRNNFGLTRRELEIVAAVVAGHSNADIAENASLSQHTVKHHIGHIFDKLGVSNRLELALFAVNHRLTGDDR